mgnify:CR=1 FL=1
MAESKGIKIVAKNSKAHHDYFIEEKYEAGIELAGTEVKSIRQGHVNLKDSFCIVKDGQMSVIGMHISPYEKGNIFNKDPRRTRKLLMHRREILRLQSSVQRDGLTLVPLSLYFKDSKVKVELGLCKGKKLYDKRATAAERDSKRDIDRAKRALMEKRGLTEEEAHHRLQKWSMDEGRRLVQTARQVLAELEEPASER